MRRKFGISTRIAAGVLAVAVLGSLHLTAADAVTSPAARAKASYEALNKYFNAGQDLLLEEYPNTHPNPYAYVWPYSQAAIAARTWPASRAPGSRRRRRPTAGSRRTSRTGTPRRRRRATTRTCARRSVRAATSSTTTTSGSGCTWSSTTSGPVTVPRWPGLAEIFDLVVHGWDTDPSHPCAGGVYWTQAPWSQDRNTVSNGPGAELGAHLYLLTENRSYLTWAKRMYEWTRTACSRRTGCTGTTSTWPGPSRRRSGATTRASCSGPAYCCTRQRVTGST